MRLVALAGAAAVLISCVFASFSEVAASLRAGRPISGAVMGTDKVDYARHSDTLMVWSYDPMHERLDLLSVPRDTRIHLPGYKFRRINEVFAYHYGVTRSAGRAAEEVLTAVRYLLNAHGMDFNLSFYLHVDYNAFREIVDLLGGVDVHVDEPMHYDDNAGNLHIHLDPGDHHLDGQQALEYVRFRGQSGDRGRILRQMEFLRAMVGKLASPMLFIRGPRLVATVFSSLHTNFHPWDVVFLALEARHLRPERLNPRLLPGQPKGAYWVMDQDRTALVVQQMTGVRRAFVSSEVKAEAGSTTVKVWNSTKKSGLALSVTRRLRAAGFDVLEWGTYRGRQKKTRVLDRAGDFEKAQRVARALGTQSVFSDVNPKLRVDVEVILGDDAYSTIMEKPSTK